MRNAMFRIDGRRSVLFGSLIALAFACASFPGAAAADGKKELTATVPDANNQLVKLGDKGVSPTRLTMKKEDSIVFFLNDSSDALATIELDFHGAHTHCASSNMEIDDDGVIRSVRPFGPGDF